MIAALALTTLTLATAQAPHLGMADRSPLALRGAGFAHGERVKVAVTLGSQSATRAVEAGAAGGFLITFRGLVYDRCHGPLKVVAIGSRGHRTSWILQPLPCPNGSSG
jgi:hypothetical protein